MSGFKWVGAALLTVLLLIAVSVLVWTILPVKTDISESDLAVDFANSIDDDKIKFEEGYFEYQGQKLHYISTGEGETIVFLHGFPSFWYSFAQQMQAFKSEYRVVAIDGLGAGKSSVPTDKNAYRLENMTAHLSALIDHLGAEKVHIIGHDWGYVFAFGFAQRYPEQVYSVIGLSAPPQNIILDVLKSDNGARKISGYIETLKQANPALILALGGGKKIYDGAYAPLVADGNLSKEEGELFRKATHNPKRINAHINWYRANIPSPDSIKETDFWPFREAKLSMPALLIWGEDDRVFAKVYAERMQELSPSVQLMSLEKIGHWPHVEETEKVNLAIR